MNFLGSLEEPHALHGVPNPASTRKKPARTISEYRRIIVAAPALPTPALPKPGQILAALTASEMGGPRYDAEWPERAAKSMW